MVAAIIILVVLPGLPAPSVTWTYTTGAAIISSPAVAGSTVYIGSGNDKVYALNAATGHPRWTYPDGGYWGLAVGGGTVYGSGSIGNVYALAAATGHPRWTYHAGNANGLSSPAVAGRTVYVGSGNGKVYALDTATGHPRWTYQVGGGNNTFPSLTVAAGTVYVGSGGGKVYALTPPPAASAGPIPPEAQFSPAQRWQAAPSTSAATITMYTH